MLDELTKHFGVPALAMALAAVVFEKLRGLDELWKQTTDHARRIARLEGLDESAHR